MLLFRCENGMVANLEKVLFFKTTSGTVGYDGSRAIKAVIVLAIFGPDNKNSFNNGDYGIALATFKSKKRSTRFY
ncbi:hypothetical protein ELD05_05635 [Caldicellulosiruptor changbaiensis]|uniref:Uncharacterized protein n=1 Tax=Caldicellulosiruptor changbaiensis TaxID=1222016 RepID=A0A3T0D514_9FIRM|nr:hypothetical protein [Caldicellulosiruptor changbaiensis]AZT90165.1 hypothetical protein ELD05_05635 [Caldicellulosiruptor changbaiensis]